ncbi:hypothetical protein MICCA_730016 [Microcystis aeruginosa PCC 9432]|uniref:Uncharacterized protein n=1 Tax=Microcystis aeruginosa PCC 9432 TaxID=1160280 RepID=A0A831A1A7_MICAE|nr:hypothetical protein MICCA_730016 [Microcystis aeruginosa PCC 9432]
MSASSFKTTLYSLEKLIEWKHTLGRRSGFIWSSTLYSLEKLIEWKLCPRIKLAS